VMHFQRPTPLSRLLAVRSLYRRCCVAWNLLSGRAACPCGHQTALLAILHHDPRQTAASWCADSAGSSAIAGAQVAAPKLGCSRRTHQSALRSSAGTPFSEVKSAGTDLRPIAGKSLLLILSRCRPRASLCLARRSTILARSHMGLPKMAPAGSGCQCPVASRKGDLNLGFDILGAGFHNRQRPVGTDPRIARSPIVHLAQM
jgi:hypothetical protein